MKLLVVIPAYNEAENLPGVVADLAAYCPDYDYLIVNDGSSDGTAQLCRERGYNLLDLPVNLGLAGAFQAGLLYALQKGYDAAVQFDGDGQHQACYVPLLAERLATGYDIVIGSRFVTVKKPINLRTAGSFLISFAMRLSCGQAICDPTSGMRAFNRTMLRKFATNLNYPPEPDTLCYLLRCGAKMCEVQVDVVPRTRGESYFTAVGSIRYMLQVAVSILLIQWFRKNDLKEDRRSPE